MRGRWQHCWSSRSIRHLEEEEGGGEGAWDEFVFFCRWWEARSVGLCVKLWEFGNLFIFTCGCALRFFVFTLFFVRNSHVNITTIIISIIIMTLIIIITRIKPQVKRLDYRGRYVGSHTDLGLGAKVSPANSGGAHQIILLALLCKILHFCAKWCRPIILFVLLCMHNTKL